MVGAPIERLEMNVGPRAASKAFKEVRHQLRLQIANQSHAHPSLDDRSRAAAEIDRCQSQGLIHGHKKVTGAHDSPFIAQRVAKGFAQCDADVLYGVVLIDVEITLGLDLEVESAVTGEQFQHVVQKTYSGLHLIAAAAFDGQSDLNVGLCGRAMERGFPHLDTPGRHLDRICSSTASTRSISARVPTLTRTQPGQSARSRKAIPWACIPARMVFFISPNSTRTKLV